MNQRDLDILQVEAQAKIDAEWDEFMAQWIGDRAPEQPAVIPPAQDNNAA